MYTCIICKYNIVSGVHEGFVVDPEPHGGVSNHLEQREYREKNCEW